MIDYNNKEGGWEDNGDNITVGKNFYLKYLKQITKYLQLSYFGNEYMGYDGIKYKVCPFLYLWNITL